MRLFVASRTMVERWSGKRRRPGVYLVLPDGRAKCILPLGDTVRRNICGCRGEHTC